LLFHQQGIDLLHPKLPVLGPPWEVPFELPIFQALGSLVMGLGAEPDLAMRSLGLLTFAAAAGLTWCLANRAGSTAGLIGLVAFLLSPLALLWSRSALIEYLATALSLGYLLLALRWIEGDGHRRTTWAGAVVVGALAMLVKVTTGVLFVIPIVMLGAKALRDHRRRATATRTTVAGLVALILIPTVAALLWTRHADAIKAASQFTSALTSSALTDWNFGTLAQKLDVRTWADYLSRTNAIAFGGMLAFWTPLVLAAGYRSSRWGLALSSVVVVWAAPVVFTNLYYVHDYYLVAVSPFIAVGFGVAAAWLRSRTFSLGRRRWSGNVVFAAATTAWLVCLLLQSPYWGLQFRESSDYEGALVAADAIRRESPPRKT